MNLEEFFKETDLEQCFLVGYYGGSNFGDELLLEVLQNILKKIGVKHVSFYYSNPKIFPVYHHKYEYRLIKSTPWNILKSVVKSKSILIGGGGLWGLDFNKNVALMSLLLFIAHYLLGKKVYLVGVGSYSSTSRLGRFFSKVAGVAANIILARDSETYGSFRRINKNTYQASDIAFLLPTLDLSIYDAELNNYALTKLVDKYKTLTLVSTRNYNDRFSASTNTQIYHEALKGFLSHTKEHVVLLFLNASDFDPAISKYYFDLKTKYKSVVSIVEINTNPILMFQFLHTYHSKIRIIAPQYHMQLLAHITGTRFLPLRYDNKNEQLFKQLEIKQFVSIGFVSSVDLE